MRNDYYSNYLMHHGIQGQKWGVRNGPPYPIETGMKKGEKLRNISWRGQSELNLQMASAGGGWLYGYNKNNLWDNKVYKGPFAYYKMRSTGMMMFEHEYEVLKDLKMPTKKERINEFVDTYKTNTKKFTKELQEVQNTMKKYNVGSEEVRKLNLKKTDISNEDDMKKAYEIFNHAMESKQKYKFTQEYSKRMAEKYDAMVDDNNQGIYNDAKDPVIIFKPSEVLKTIGEARMIPIDEVMKNLDEVDAEMKRKGKKGAML